MNVSKLRSALNKDAKVGAHVLFEEGFYGPRREYVITKIVKEGTKGADTEVMIKPFRHKPTSDFWYNMPLEVWQLEVEAT